MRLSFIAPLGAVLIICTAAFAQDTGLDHPAGAKEPNEAQKQEMQLRQVKGVRANKVAIDRVNLERARKGLAPIPTAGAAALGADELVTATSGTSGPVVGATPATVDNSTNAAFPPVGNQGGVGSCTCWATTYYQFSYETAFARGLSNSTQAAPTVFSPKWCYNMINSGADNGSYWGDAYNLLEKHGAASLSQFPYDGNVVAWDLNPADWQSAINYRATSWSTISGMDTAAGQANLKQLLANGHVATFATYIYSWNFTTIQNDPTNTADNSFVGQNAMIYQSGSSGGHMMTIVGYDDSIWIDVNGNGKVDPGELGAFKVANSWGNWMNSGFIWVSYDSFYASSQVSGGPNSGRVETAWYADVYPLTVKAAYTPKLLAQFTINSAARNQVEPYLGASATSGTSPTSTWYPGAIAYQGGALAFDGTTTACDGTFVFDLTDLVPGPGGSENYYVQVNDSASGNPTTLKAMSLIDPVHNVVVSYTGTLPLVADGSTVSVHVGYNTTGGDLPPVAVIAATETVGANSVSVNFDGSGSTDPDGTVVAWQWNFGDGSAGLSGAMVNHVYTKPGTFTATLTVTDNSGSVGAANFAVTVADTTPPTTPTTLTATLGQVASGNGKHRTYTTVVKLAWHASTDDSGSVSYKIYRNGALLTTTASTAFTDTTTTTGQLWSYYVIAVDPTGNASGQSNTATVQR
jgi:C1A family cysteine protease/PKD repeat protein